MKTVLALSIGVLALSLMSFKNVPGAVSGTVSYNAVTGNYKLSGNFLAAADVVRIRELSGGDTGPNALKGWWIFHKTISILSVASETLIHGELATVSAQVQAEANSIMAKYIDTKNNRALIPGLKIGDVGGEVK